MKYQGRKLRQMLAAEYVLGTLRGAARRRFRRLLRTDATLGAEVSYWETRLAGFNNGYAPVPPRALVWAEIEHQINASKVTPLRPAAQRWTQAWAGMATAASVLLAVALYRESTQPLPPPEIRTVRVEVPVEVAQPMPYVAVLQPQQGDAKWMIAMTPEKGLMKVAVSGNYPIDHKTQCLQLWVLDAAGKPHSLGMLPMHGDLQMPVPTDMPPMPESPTLAISVEKMGEPMTDGPKGPVIHAAPAVRAI